MAKAAKPIPKGYHTVTPHSMLDNAAQAIEWYKKGFGAQEIGRHLGPDGKIMHAVIKIGDSFVIVNDVMPGQKGPQAYGGSPVSVWLYVDDSDALFNRAVAAGARWWCRWAISSGATGAAQSPIPRVTRWWIATRKEDLTTAELEQRAGGVLQADGAAAGCALIPDSNVHVLTQRRGDAEKLLLPERNSLRLCGSASRSFTSSFSDRPRDSRR